MEKHYPIKHESVKRVPGVLNSDGVLTLADVGMFSGRFGQSAGKFKDYDPGRDKKITIKDARTLAMLVRMIRQSNAVLFVG